MTLVVAARIGYASIHRMKQSVATGMCDPLLVREYGPIRSILITSQVCQGILSRIGSSGRELSGYIHAPRYMLTPLFWPFQ